MGTYYREPHKIESCPETVTGIGADDAMELSADKIEPEEGETARAPILVHDGPRGREAWLIEVLKNRESIRWIFVTPSFVYERPAGEMLAEDTE
jgi:hypothetical protein